MKNLTAFLAGTFFSCGLLISGMTIPARVQGFLDLFGNWDPTLLFVMASAVVTYAVGYALLRRARTSPVLAPEFLVPESSQITPALAIGAIMFGVGWGLAGYCPGPALASLASLQMNPWIFVGTMAIGMLGFRELHRLWKFPQ